MIRFLTGGESHGKGITVIIDGIPAGLKVSIDFINQELHRRQIGYGRGKRMAIEQDDIEILGGIRKGKTLGSPIVFFIQNRDYKNWQEIMAVESNLSKGKVTIPRPGHADLPGVLKYGFDDIRNVIERASARESVGRVAAGAICKTFLKKFGVEIYSHTISIGNISISRFKRLNQKLTKETPLRCIDKNAEIEMIKLIDQAKKNGDTLGGIARIIAKGTCPGLGNYVQYDKRLDAQIGMAMLSIPAVKGVEIGTAFENAHRFGSKVHDAIYFNQKKGFYRRTNNAGGIEGGMSNGDDIIVQIAIKPVPTMGRPLDSVDIRTKKKVPAHKERSDTCVVPAVGVIAEAMLAIVLTNAMCEKFGGDCMIDILNNYKLYIKRIENG